MMTAVIAAGRCCRYHDATVPPKTAVGILPTGDRPERTDVELSRTQRFCRSGARPEFLGGGAAALSQPTRGQLADRQPGEAARAGAFPAQRAQHRAERGRQSAPSAGAGSVAEREAYRGDDVGVEGGDDRRIAHRLQHDRGQVHPATAGGGLSQQVSRCPRERPCDEPAGRGRMAAGRAGRNRGGVGEAHPQRSRDRAVPGGSGHS